MAYDIQGVLYNSSISSNIIASIVLYPDSEIDVNPSFVSFREEIKNGKAFSPASHLFTIREFKEFLENHKVAVESELEESKEEDLIKDGSYYGKAGNALEKEVVKILNNKEYLKQYNEDKCEEVLFNSLLGQFCNKELNKNNIRSISSTNTVQKLAKGGNAKTDVIITITTNNGESHIKTLSIKRSKATVVSCHDYKYNDFVRVLKIENTKLEEYFKLFQANPTYSAFEKNLPDGFNIKDFEERLTPYIEKLTQWVLTGQHDDINLIDYETQISEYVLIVTNTQVYCNNFMSYINKINSKSKKKFGVPFSWTYPSKQRGKRIQLKMPILID
ncbi:MAG: Unknown protein [uncultured Sulfurovum sp.]|uniref:Uncharacterized protein n=1 Tax=uncultured Sulfurovum sp. TaxID=269237 RepID=A0A6S6UFW4_9BACT|nr:MAG: Unknown protein [uncultured Sulfurovum sp.]